MAYVLKNDRIRVTLEEPKAVANQTFRFDRAGFITSVILDGKHEFCTKEPTNLTHPCSGGAGLCFEYQLEGADAEAASGESFSKPGVGNLIAKDDKGFVFYEKYDGDLFPIDVEETSDSIRFVTHPLLCRGYAFYQERTVRISENRIIMEAFLKNAGERAAYMREYCHNFITIDALPLGQEYFLALSGDSFEGCDSKENATVKGVKEGLCFTQYSDSAAMVFLEGDRLPRTVPFTWKLSNRNSPASISGKVYAAPERMVMWCIDHIISPEVFVRFCLQPGESFSWKREWILED